MTHPLKIFETPKSPLLFSVSFCGQLILPVLKGEELKLLGAPFHNYSLQFGLNVLLLHGRDTDVLNVLLVGEQRRLHDISESKSRSLQFKFELGEILDSRPMSELHRLVGHQLQDGADVTEVVNDLLEILECWPLLAIRFYRIIHNICGSSFGGF